MTISKRDLFNMDQRQQAAGKKMWQKSEATGALAMSSTDYEMMSLKTWVRYVDSKGAEIGVIECELYHQPNADGQAVGMLCGMCPKCGECFLVNEGNKTMHLGDITYGRAPAWLKTHWAYHKRQLNQIVSDDDKIPMVSSPERWACDYCKSWCVKVTENVASDHYKGVTFVASSFGVDTVRSTATPSTLGPVAGKATSGDFDI